MDALIEASAETLEPVERRHLLNRALQAVMSDLPVIPLYVENAFAASRADVDWPQRPGEYLFLKSFRFVAPGVR